jgi:hypothetical protein
MRGLARLALKLLTGASSVFIAACYGVPYDGEELDGLVLDAQTRAGIPGVRVGCLYGGDEVNFDMTDDQGAFHMRGPHCAEVRAEDLDGAVNGAYATKTVPCDGSGNVVVELDLLP